MISTKALLHRTVWKFRRLFGVKMDKQQQKAVNKLRKAFATESKPDVFSTWESHPKAIRTKEEGQEPAVDWRRNTESQKVYPVFCPLWYSAPNKNELSLQSCKVANAKEILPLLAAMCSEVTGVSINWDDLYTHWCEYKLGRSFWRAIFSRNLESIQSLWLRSSSFGKFSWGNIQRCRQSFMSRGAHHGIIYNSKKLETT